MSDNELFDAMIKSTSSPAATALSVVIYIAALIELAVSPAIVIAVWRWAL